MNARIYDLAATDEFPKARREAIDLHAFGGIMLGAGLSALLWGLLLAAVLLSSF